MAVERSAPRRWASRVAGWIEPETNPTGVIYGTITAGALLVAESTRRETLVEAVGATAVALVLYWLVHAYASALGERLETDKPWTARHLGAVAVHELALLQGAALPLVVLIVAGVVGADARDATTAALAAAVVLLVALEAIAGVRSRLSVVALIVQIVVSSLIGIGVFALKVALH